MPIEKDYSFETDEGTKTLAELFDGRSQLLVYHFMFGLDTRQGAPSAHPRPTVSTPWSRISMRRTTFLCISRAPLEKLNAYKQRMGWRFPGCPRRGSDFNFDFQVSAPQEQVTTMLEAGTPPVVAQMAADCGTDPTGYLTEAQALSAFALSDGIVHHASASAYARGVEIVMGFYLLLDLPVRATRVAPRRCGSAATTSTDGPGSD